MKNKEYYFCIEDDDLDSFLSFCEVNNITYSNGSRFPLGKTTFVLKNNEITAVSDIHYSYDWDDFVEEYYIDLFYGMSRKEVIGKLMSDRYSFDGLYFTYKDFLLDPEYVIDCLDEINCDLLEIIFGSSEPIGHSKKPTVESKSYLDFNPLN